MAQILDRHKEFVMTEIAGRIEIRNRETGVALKFNSYSDAHKRWRGLTGDLGVYHDIYA